MNVEITLLKSNSNEELHKNEIALLLINGKPISFHLINQNHLTRKESLDIAKKELSICACKAIYGQEVFTINKYNF